MDTRGKILQVAARLFSTQGYADTSLAQVARAAHVSKALVLWHFDSKERLFRAALQHFLTPYAIDDQRLRGLTESDQLEKLIDDYYDFIAEHLYSVKFVLSQVVREEENSKELIAHVSELYRMYRGLLATIIERGQTAAVFTTQVRPAEEATLIMATLNGLFVQQLVEPEGTGKTREFLASVKQSIQTRLCLPRRGEGSPLIAGTCSHETARPLER